MKAKVFDSTHPLRQPVFFRLAAVSFCAEITRWLLLIALPLYALRLTGSGLVTAMVTMIGLLPSLLLTPMAGVLADRWNLARFMGGLSVVRIGLLLPLLVVHDVHQLWIVYLVTTTESGLTTIFEMVTDSMVPAVVEPAQLMVANATISLNTNLGRLIGSPLGGFVLAWAGINGVVGAAVVPLVLTGVLVLSMSGVNAMGPPAPQTVWSWRESLVGVRTIWSTPRSQSAALIIGLMSMAQGLFVILFLLFTTETLHSGGSLTGLLRGVQAVGGLIGGAIAGRLVARLPVARFVGYSLLSFGLISAVIWNSALLTTAVWWYVGLFTLAGAPGVWVMAGWLSLVQEATPAGQRGRVLSAFLAMSDGLQALSIMLAGVLSGFLPTIWLLNGQAVVLFAAAVVAWRTPARAVTGVVTD